MNGSSGSLAPRPEDVRRVESLAEAVCEGRLSADAAADLDRLLAGDLTLCQVYLNYMQVFAALTAPDESVAGLSETDRGLPLRRATRRLPRVVAFAAAACGLVAIFGGSFAAILLRKPPAVATVQALSEDAEVRSSDFGIGTLVRPDERVRIEAGVVTFRGEAGTTVDVRGPATVSWSGDNRLKLITGRLRAVVPPPAVGFTVLTERAEVVDLGTEFVVEHRLEEDTRVGVRSGRVDAYALDTSGYRLRVASLVAGQSAVFDRAAEIYDAETAELGDWFDRRVGRLRSLSGAARLAAETPEDVTAGGTVTRSHVLVIPERRGVVLDRPLVVGAGDRARTLPAGTPLRSYLVHFDPHLVNARAPKGTLRFAGPIAAVAADASSLDATDEPFGLSETAYGGSTERGLEDGDDATATADGRVLKFNLEIDLGSHVRVDQVRVLTFEET
ncbi:MAG: FecR domain-containing protein [Planctomycetota bacterium]